MAWYRLHLTSQTHVALDRLFNLMNEMGVSIEIGAYGRLTVKHDGKEVDMVDIEQPADSDRQPISNIPPLFEYKLVFEKDDE
jgi:hypothetical protein